MPDFRPSKRQRISRACDQCRRRKSKCDGAQPICSICRAAGRSCTYNPSGRRRGLQSGYVRALQAILGIVLETVPNSETTVKAILGDVRSQGDFLGSDLSERYIAVWRGSKLSQETLQMLDPSVKRVSDDDDELEREPELELEPKDTPISTALAGMTSNVCSNCPDHPPQSQSLSLNRPSDITAWPLPENVVQIVEYYFSHVHSWFPILERRDILRSMHNDPMAPDDPTAGGRITLWAVILYVLVARDGMNPERHSWRAQIQTFLQLRILEDSDGLQQSHAEALLVLVLLDMGIGDLSKAWVGVGLAERLLAILPISARDVRYGRTRHGCCFLDTLISALMEQTPYQSGVTRDEYGKIDEDGLEEWDVWVPFRWDHERMQYSSKGGPLRALSAFNLNSELAQHLARMLHLQPARDDAGRLMADFQDWKQALARRYPVASSHNPALLTLHLASEFVTSHVLCKLLPPSSSAVASAKANLGDPNPARAYTSHQAHESDDISCFDAVLEEMAMMHAETAPSFAHNLGFCAGDIDSEFLDSLRYLDPE
ncbi:C6 transcription factor [Aspergillus terreus]|uniref:C6 transcription factor n=1 Tax=Aspergillus terreus TaxID=33178 RepID=A0A5M3Z9B2_ASPTE|nr:hypothetical protein ATETN484_0011029700 [Aspergillus terreus]GFF18934.1 C6 transcription factor [Aspergillus terreus]